MMTKDDSELKALILEDAKSEFDWDVDDIDADEDQNIDVVRFSVGGLLLAAEGLYIREVVAASAITSIPGTPDHIRGITLLKREVLGILDLGLWFGLPPIKQVEGSRMLVARSSSFSAGIIVDSVDGIESWPQLLDSSSLPESLDSRIRDYSQSSRWAPGGVVVLLDIQAILEATAVQ